MKRRISRIAMAAAVMLAVLAGCNVYNLRLNVIVGSIFVESATPVAGGTPYHVLLYQPPDTIQADIDSTVNSLIPAAHLDGTFQATGTGHLTTNFILYDVPAGEYFLFVWVDQNEINDYDHLNDLLGFYDEPIEPATAWTRIGVEPGAPNVVMTADGIVDIDVWVGAY